MGKPQESPQKDTPTPKAPTPDAETAVRRFHEVWDEGMGRSLEAIRNGTFFDPIPKSIKDLKLPS